MLEVVDSSDLTGADWAEINKLKSAYAVGELSFRAALARLAQDHPIRYLTVMYALDPAGTRELVRDNMAANEVGDDAVREMIARLS